MSEIDRSAKSKLRRVLKEASYELAVRYGAIFVCVSVVTFIASMISGSAISPTKIGTLTAAIGSTWLAAIELFEHFPGLKKLVNLAVRPKGRLLDALLPPEEAEHRFLELDEAFDRWELKYGFRNAKRLYIWQSVVSICLFWFDRVLVKVLARK